ncbi:MAG: hypothetical protein M3443_01005 [Actinomycetota bacterium]|nr:hypothetical protein [Actinomycetota bacterium]
MAGEADRRRRELIAAELRSVLTGARTLTALRGLDLPELDQLLDGCGASRDDLPRWLAEAISRLDDPLYRAAAADLFPLPYCDDGAWPKLAARGRSAGNRFGISYDGFRRSPAGRPSRMDEVLCQVADSLLSVLGHEGEAEESASPTRLPPTSKPDQLNEDTEETKETKQPVRGRHSRVIVSGGLAAAVLVVLLLVWLGSRDSRLRGTGSVEGSFKPDGCDVGVGALDRQLSAEPDARQLTGRLVSTYRSAGEAQPLGCPAAPARRWQSIVLQELERDGRQAGALLISPNDVDLYLNNAAWGSYHQVGGKKGDTAQTTAGLPMRVVPYADGHVEIEFSRGIVLVAEAADAPYFWIPAVFVSWWRDHQASTGLPTGNPLPTFRQDFQRGYVTVNPPQVAVPVLTVVDKPQEELPTLDTIRERILRQPDGTSWFITAEGKRQWIPDLEVWDCLGGDSKRVSRDLPGYAVASLPYGGQAECRA